jgi:hypothetical protein
VSAPRSAGFLDAVRALRDALTAAEVRWLIIGGVAVIARGVARFTADVDATIRARDVPLERLFETLGRHHIVPRIDQALEFARERQVLLLRHDPSGVPLDVSLAWLPFEEAAIEHGEDHDYAGVPIRIPLVEDLIIYKVVASRPHDLDDAERLLLLYGPRVDVRRLRALVAEFADALDDVGRPATLERMLARAGLSS